MLVTIDISVTKKITFGSSTPTIDYSLLACLLCGIWSQTSSMKKFLILVILLYLHRVTKVLDREIMLCNFSPHFVTCFSEWHVIMLMMIIIMVDFQN